MFNYIEKEERPWGTFYVVHDQKNYKIKRLEVNPGERLSYQYHLKRSETWVIIKGNPTIVLDDQIQKQKEGDTLVIKQGVKHRIENDSEEIIIMIEVQTGSYFGEDDIVRIEDDSKICLADSCMALIEDLIMWFAHMAMENPSCSNTSVGVE